MMGIKFIGSFAQDSGVFPKTGTRAKSVGVGGRADDSGSSSAVTITLSAKSILQRAEGRAQNMCSDQTKRETFEWHFCGNFASAEG